MPAHDHVAHLPVYVHNDTHTRFSIPVPIRINTYVLPFWCPSEREKYPLTLDSAHFSFGIMDDVSTSDAESKIRRSLFTWCLPYSLSYSSRQTYLYNLRGVRTCRTLRSVAKRMVLRDAAPWLAARRHTSRTCTRQQFC